LSPAVSTRLPFVLDVHSDAAPAWDPTSARLAVATREGLCLVPARQPGGLVVLSPPELLRSMSWSPSGELLVCAADGVDRLRAHRALDGAEVWRCSVGDVGIDELVWSPDGRHLACVGEAIVVCDGGTGAPRWRHARTHLRTSVTIDGRRGSEQARFVEVTDFPGEVSWSFDSTLLAVRWPGAWRVLAAADGTTVAEGTLPGLPASGGDRVLWTSHGDGLFEAGSHRLGHCVLLGDRWARSFTFSSDGRWAAAEGDAHRLIVAEGEVTRVLQGHPRTITAMGWSTDGVLATGCRDGVVRRLAMPQGNIEPWSELPARQDSLCWSPDGGLLAACCGDAVFVLRWPAA
jgi:WD40 repeat protein